MWAARSSRVRATPRLLRGTKRVMDHAVEKAVG
jgi:hypothetical protein